MIVHMKQILTVTLIATLIILTAGCINEDDVVTKTEIKYVYIDSIYKPTPTPTPYQYIELIPTPKAPEKTTITNTDQLDGQNIRVGANQIINCGKGCNIDCGFNCEIYCHDGCNIDCGDDCYIECGRGCNIYHGERCSINHGHGCNTLLLYPD